MSLQVTTVENSETAFELDTAENAGREILLNCLLLPSSHIMTRLDSSSITYLYLSSLI